MDEFIAWLWTVTYWHWWAFGLILILVEVFVPSTFLVGPATGALALGFAVVVFPELDWRYQVLIFAVLALVFSVAWLMWLKRHPLQTDRPRLNTRAYSYVGRRLTLGESLTNGRGRVQVDDTWWTAQAEDGAEIEAEQKVEVTGADGATLTVRRIDSDT